MVRLEKLESTFRAGNIPYDADMEWDKIQKILIQQKAVEVPEEVSRYHDSKIAFIQSVHNHMALLRTNIEKYEEKSQAILDKQTATQTQETEKAQALLAQMTSSKEKEIQELRTLLEEGKVTITSKEEDFVNAKRALETVALSLEKETKEQEQTIQMLRESLEEQKATHKGTIAQLQDALLEQKKNVQATKDDLVKRFEKYFNDAQFKYPTEKVKGIVKSGGKADPNPDPAQGDELR